MLFLAKPSIGLARKIQLVSMWDSVELAKPAR